MEPPKEFLARLREEVEAHQGVNHTLLARVSHVPFTREDYKIFGLQHYPLVGRFTLYLEYLQMRAKILELAASLDRIDRGEGSVDSDPRVELIAKGIELLSDEKQGRATEHQQFR